MCGLSLAITLSGCGLLADDGFDPTDFVDSGLGRNDVGRNDVGSPDTGPVECDSDAECDDNDVCNGAEFCGDDGFCVSSPALACADEDSIPCTVAACDPQRGCVEVPDDALCAVNETCGDSGCMQAICGDDLPCRNPEPCGNEVACVSGLCVAQGPKICPETGTECLVSTCEAGICVTAPDSSRCGTKDDCGRGVCSVTGSCGFERDASLCPMPRFSCVEPRCELDDGDFDCVQEANNDRCDDGVPCTEQVCAPGTNGADPNSGCMYSEFNDSMCQRASDTCIIDICTVHGCTGELYGECDPGKFCSPATGDCESLPNTQTLCEMANDSPCGPDLDYDTEESVCYVIDDPCSVGVGGGEEGYCEFTTGSPQCQVRPVLNMVN